MIKVCVVGASGYTGAELVRILHSHCQFELAGTYVSHNSQDAGKKLAELHPILTGSVHNILEPLTDELLNTLAHTMDGIFLATPHEASHDWMPILSAGKATIFDLSGAFRLQDTQVFANYYGFAHQHTKLLENAIYGLADWHQSQIESANIIAVPGCYPTASLTALKPLFNNHLLDPEHRPIINAVSGTSGAGRKAALNNSFCEVSLQAYGVLGHRHQPEIASHLGTEVIFTPHLGSFKRGILATITAKLKTGTTAESISQAFSQAYTNSVIVRLLNTFPRLDDVVNTPYCDVHWKFDTQSGYIVIGSAIDNLLKGAASQAVQCANIKFGFADALGLVAGIHE